MDLSNRLATSQLTLGGQDGIGGSGGAAGSTEKGGQRGGRQNRERGGQKERATEAAA